MKFVMKCGIGKKQLKISFKKGQVLYLTVYGVRIKIKVQPTTKYCFSLRFCLVLLYIIDLS